VDKTHTKTERMKLYLNFR